MATSRSRPNASDLSDTALDALIGETATPEALGALFRRLQKRLAERILAGGFTSHLGYAPGAEKPADQTSYRNGSSAKTVLTEPGALPLDRDGTFTPQLVPKGVRRLPHLALLFGERFTNYA